MRPKQFITLVAAVYFIVILDGGNRGTLALRLLNLDVPAAVIQGEPVWLNCTLDLEAEDLYSVKWYRNDVEFYRFLPRDSPSGQKWDLPGMFVDLSRSKQGNVYLWKTDLNTEGLFRCEASAESPTFQTVEGEKYMTIYVLPKEGPVIYGNQPRYEVGDFVNLTCKSGPSKPAATLKWSINDKDAPPELITTTTITEHPSGLQTSTLGLLFYLSPRHFKHSGDPIVLRCTAIVFQTYSMPSEELVVGDHIFESSSPSGTKLPLIKEFYSRDGPVIIGGESRYRVGDVLNINCSSSKFNKTPLLQWLLNDQEVDKRYVIHYPLIKHPDGQETSILGLRFLVQPEHFDEHDEIRLKCTATLSEAINTRSQERTVGGNHRSSGLHVSEDQGKVLDRNSAETVGYCFPQALCLVLVALGSSR